MHGLHAEVDEPLDGGRLPDMTMIGIAVTECGYDYRHPAEVAIDRPNGHPQWILVTWTTAITVWSGSDATIHPPGSSVLWAPGMPIRYHGAGAAWANHWCHLEGGGIAQLAAGCGLKPGRIVMPRDPAALAAPLRQMAAERVRAEPGWEVLCSGLAVQLIAQLGRQAAASKPAVPARHRVRLGDLRAGLHRDPGRPWSVAGLARSAGLSPQRLSALWRNCWGISPRDDVIAARCARAAWLLDSTVMPVAAVAEACGFPDPRYFSRCFGRRMGSSPAAWRRR